MFMGRIRLVCCDLDGTLLSDDKSIGEENIFWIKKLREEKEVPFVIVSGRYYPSVKRIADRISTTGPLSCVNGALLYDEEGNEIKSHTLPFEVAEYIYSLSTQYKVEMLAVKGKDWLLKRREGYLFKEKKPIYITDGTLVSFKDALSSIPVNKLLFMAEEKEELNKLENEIRSKVGEGVSYYTGSDFLEIMPAGTNKGQAIQDLSKLLRIPMSEIMVIGDDINDIEMLEEAGTSVVMENADQRIKALGDYITLKNNDNGVAHAIKHFWNEISSI